MPNIWNDALATVGQKTQLLFNIRNSMGPGITRMITALRTPAGRPVSAMGAYRLMSSNQNNIILKELIALLTC